MTTTNLSEPDLDRLLHAFEEKYDARTSQLQDACIRANIPEDDLLRWETYAGWKRSLTKGKEGGE